MLIDAELPGCRRREEADGIVRFSAESASSRRRLRFQRAARRARSGFTLAEVLAALAFMAIVIPVAVEGLRVANLAGQVGQRKAVAARVAERVLNEWIVTGQSQTARQSGTVREGVVDYAWSIRTQPWNQDTMRLVTVSVVYQTQGQDYDVNLSTLLDNSTR
jgi:prepilin-type N-terminal cleavage/methylation domain-containing protein